MPMNDTPKWAPDANARSTGKARRLRQALPLNRRATTSYSVVEEEDHDGPDYSHKHAVEIQASNALRTELGEEEAPDHGPDDTENDIQENALTGLVDDFAGNESS